MYGPRGRPSPGTNRLFSILPPASRERLLAIARPVRLEFGQELMHAGGRIEHVYFPQSGVVSIVVSMRDGRGVDAASTGFEGMVGAAVVLGQEQSPFDDTVQVEGEALQIPTGDFRQALSEDAALRDVMLRYVEVRLIQVVRTAACNRLHAVEERLARWLLHTHDWVWDNRFHITQDFLAAMLGVRRATVTVAAGTLQRAGLIAYRRGDITILDRQGLEDVACEDYAAIRDAFDRLLALPT
jgi:CRP-like cAMP-binding protein